MSPYFPHRDFIAVGSARFSPDEVVRALGPMISEERRTRIAEVVAGRTCSVVPVMECLYDRGNVSAVVRSAEALGYQCIHNIDTSEKYRHAGRVTQGAEKWVDMRVWNSTRECLDDLEGRGYRLLATHLEDARPLAEVDFIEPCALVFGNEHEGVSEEVLARADARVVLPMAGFTQSFNISVAAALCLYHIQQDRVRRRGTHADLTAEERARLTAEFYYRSLVMADLILRRHRHDETV